MPAQEPEAVKACWADAAGRQNSQGKRLCCNGSQSPSSLSCSLLRERRQEGWMYPTCLLRGLSRADDGLCSAVQLGAHLRPMLKGFHKQDESFLPLLAHEIWADKNFLKIASRWGCGQNREDSDYFHLLRNCLMLKEFTHEDEWCLSPALVKRILDLIQRPDNCPKHRVTMCSVAGLTGSPVQSITASLA